MTPDLVKHGQPPRRDCHRQWSALRTRNRHGFQLLVVAILVGSVVAGCVRTVKVRVINGLPIRLLMKRVSVPHSAYRTDVILGWAEPKAVTMLPRSVGLASAAYRLRAFAPDGKVVAEINATQDEVERHLHGNTWTIEIRKPVQPAGKPKQAIE